MTFLLFLALLLNIFLLLKSSILPSHLIRQFLKRFRALWKLICKSNSRSPGRPPIPQNIRDIIKKIYLENIQIGGLKIWMLLRQLGIEISLTSVYRILRMIKEIFFMKNFGFMSENEF